MTILTMDPSQIKMMAIERLNNAPVRSAPMEEREEISLSPGQSAPATSLPAYSNEHPEMVQVEATLVADEPNASDTSMTGHPQTTIQVVALPQQEKLHQQPMGQGSPIPAGARWVTVKYNGVVTWSTCATVSVVTCLFTLLPCGAFAFFCPCDSKRAYEHNGYVFDEFGKPLGHVNNLRVVY